MSGQFAGKTVAITGAAGGIGQWLCRFFGQEGATIAALDRNAKVIELVDSARQRRHQGDGGGGRHLLGGGREGRFRGFRRRPPADQQCRRLAPPDAWRSPTRRAGKSDVASNLNGAYACAHAVLPQMVARRSGSIVNVSSVNGLLALGDPAYSAAKAGMIAMTRALAMEYGRYGIRANCVLPGTVRTPIWDERKAKDPNVLKQLERWYPLGRIVEPDEVARVIAFLASDAASAVTGVALPVDCGLTAGNIVMARELTLEDF